MSTAAAAAAAAAAGAGAGASAGAGAAAGAGVGAGGPVAAVDGSGPAFLDRWPQSWPRQDGDWTVRGSGGWGLLDPESGRVRSVDPAADDRLPGIAAAVADGGRLVSYRAGRRAVVVDPAGRYVKVVRRSRADRLARLHAAVGQVIDQSGGDGPRVPGVVGCAPDGRVTLSAVGGLPLHELLLGASRTGRVSSAPRPSAPGPPGIAHGAGADGGLEIDAVLGRVATALTRFHQARLPEPLDVRRADHPDQWLAIVGRVEPHAVADLSSLAATLPPVPNGGSDTVHGDLHDKNLLVDGDVIGLIDLDGVALGAAEDDLANLAVHLEFRALQAGLPDHVGRRWAATLLAAAADAAGRQLCVDRLHATTRHTWFRLACLYRFRASGRHLVPTLAQRAAAT